MVCLFPGLLPLTCTCPSPVQGNNSSGDIVINTLQWGLVQIYNTTLTCGAAVAAANSTTPVTLVAPPVTLVAETALQLLWGIRVLGKLQPSTIILPRDMAVPADTWPKGLLVNRSMVLTGLSPPAQRTILDLYQVRSGGRRSGWWSAGRRGGGYGFGVAPFGNAQAMIGHIYTYT